MSIDNESQLREAIGRIDVTTESEYVRDVTADLIQDYARVSGDYHPLHVDEEYARRTPYGRLIAHGAMLVGFMSTASTLLSEAIEADIGHSNVSLGYDRLRFVAPVFAGDTITTRIRITELQPMKLRVICEEKCVNQQGETVAIGSHVMRFI